MKIASLLAPVLAGASSSPAQDCAITIERAGACFEAALPAVEKALGMELGDHLQLRLATVDDAAEAIARENEPILRTQFGEQAEAQAKSFGEAVAGTLLAKYAWSNGELLVVAENFPRLAEMIELPELCSDDTLRAILVHELVHAHDHLRFEFDVVLGELGDSGKIQAYNALIEGHAQHAARKICAAQGWSSGFETFVRSIGAMPRVGTEEGAAVELLTKVAMATVAASYLQGERFVAALEDAGGEEAIARAFSEPPADMEVVYHPEWYLDPSLRPVASCDFDSAVALAKERFEESQWHAAELTITPEQLRVATSMIPTEQAERMLAGMVANRLVQFASKAAPESRQTTLVLYEFRSVEDAAWFVAGDELVMRAKDEQMNSGAIRIESARYEPFTLDGSVGFLARKQMKVGPQDVEVVAGCAGRGRLVAEATIVGETAADAEHIELLDALLRRAGGETAAARSAATFTFEELDLGPLPEEWTAATSTPDESPNEWRVVEEGEAPSGARVLALSTDNRDDTFNLLFAPGTAPADVDLSVSLRALSGEVDQGGGLVWRARDAANYYLARWNPLEQNVRIYTVTDGRRKQLQSAAAELDASAWHELAITAHGTRMRVLLDGKEVLSIEDAAIDAAGRVGLWTKADASTAFDDLSITPGGG